MFINAGMLVLELLELLESFEAIEIQRNTMGNHGLLMWGDAGGTVEKHFLIFKV